MRGQRITKDTSQLPPDVQAQVRALEALPDDQIDTTDAPEILDWADARHGIFYHHQASRPGRHRGI